MKSFRRGNITNHIGSQQAPDVRVNFSKKAFSVVNVRQSPFLAYQGNFYAVVGQSIIRSSPMFTHYQVFDEAGNLASEAIAEKVYTYVAMSQMITYMSEQKSHYLTDRGGLKKSSQREEEDESVGEIVRLKYLSRYDVNLTDVQVDNDRIHHLFEKVEAANKELTEVEYWTEEMFQRFFRKWSAFWNVYQERMSLLFSFYSFTKEYGDFDDVLAGTELGDMYSEAKIMYELFSKSIPEKAPLIEDVHDFILAMAQLGYVPKYADERNNHRVGSSLDFLGKIVKGMLWAIPLIFVLYLFDVISFSLLTMAVFISLASYFSEIIIRNRIEKSVEKAFIEERMSQIIEQSIIREKYQKAYDDLQKVPIQHAEKVYEIPGTYNGAAYTFMILGVIVGLYGFLVYRLTSEHLMTTAMIVGALFFIGILFKNYHRGMVYLSSEKITFKRRKYFIKYINHIWMSSKGHKLYIRLVFHRNRPFILNIPKGYRDEAKETFQKWCTENNVTESTIERHSSLKCFFRYLFFIVISIILLIIFVAIFQ